MKKFICATLAVFLIVISMAGCGADKDSENGGKSAASGKIKIVTTIFPDYDWVRTILGEKEKDAELTLLLDNGVDLHSYQPTAEDILKIATCDMFIYVGGESDEWVEDVLKEATNKEMVVINLLEVLGDAVKEEEVVEGMQEEEHHGEDEKKEEHHDEEEEETEYDEHVWLSLRNARTLVDFIAAAIAEKDSENSAVYLSNAASYNEKLAKLDAEYKEAVNAATKHTILFGDRFPFRYLADDYDLDYYAAFVGCSAETEASFETVVFLAEKVNELKLNAILTIESSDGKIAKTISENTKSKDQKILILDSMQSATSKDVEKGTTYLSIMEKNLEVLKEALK